MCDIFTYKNGTFKCKGEISNELKTGPWYFYYENGQVEKEGMYRNGKEEGEWKRYTKEGKIINTNPPKSTKKTKK